MRGATLTPDAQVKMNCDSMAVRRAKAEAKRYLREGGDLVAVLRDPPARLRIYDALRCLPKVGERLLEEIFAATGIYPLRYVAELTPPERGRLVLYLRNRCVIDRELTLRRAKKLRARGFTYEEIADEFGVTTPIVAHWLTGAA